MYLWQPPLRTIQELYPWTTSHWTPALLTLGSCFMLGWRRNTTLVQVKCNCTGTSYWIYPQCQINEVSWTGRAQPWKAMSSFSFCAPLKGLRSEPTGQVDLWRRGTRQVSRKLVYWWVAISSHQLVWTDTCTFLSLYTLKVRLWSDKQNQATIKTTPSSLLSRKREHDLHNMDFLPDSFVKS